MDLTVVVPTHNRARLLEGTLESLAAQTLEHERYEVLIVDNASSDATPEVAERWRASGAFACRSVREEALGLNYARNRGLTEAAAPIVAFLDDDARADPVWLAALLDAFARDAPDGVGGPIELEPEVPLPGWIHRNHLQLLAAFDLGAETVRVERYPFLVGTNLAITRKAFERFGTFDPDLDRRGSSLLSAGDTELCRRVVAGGGKLLYEPRARVRHWVPAERVRLSFLVRRSYQQGRSICLYQRKTGARDRNPSRPGAVLRVLTELPWALGRRDWRESARVVTTLAWHLGYLREARG